MKTKLEAMLKAYRDGERGPIEYHDLANLLVEQGNAEFDAGLLGVGYLVDGTNVHPSRVTVLRATAPVQAQEPVADKLSYDAQIDEWAIEKSNLEREIEELKSRAPVQPVTVPDIFEQVRFRFFKDLNSEERKKVFKAFGVWPGDGEGKNIPHVWETLLLRSIFSTAAPAAQGDAKELTDDEIVRAVRSVGVDTHPSKFGFIDEQIEGMSVTVLRQVIAAIAAKAAS